MTSLTLNIWWLIVWEFCDFSTTIVKRVISRVFEPIINHSVNELERLTGEDKIEDDEETGTESKMIKVI